MRADPAVQLLRHGALVCIAASCQFPNYSVSASDAGSTAGQPGDAQVDASSAGGPSVGGDAGVSGGGGPTSGGRGGAGGAEAQGGAGGGSQCPNGPVVIDLITNSAYDFYSFDLGVAGKWNLVHDGTSTDYSGKPVGPGCDDDWSLALSGSGFADWGLGWALTFESPEDLSQYTGLRFALKGDPAKNETVLILIRQEGGGGPIGMSPLGPVTAQWQAADFPFSQIQIGGEPSNAKPIFDIEFRPADHNAAFDYQIDNIVLY